MKRLTLGASICGCLFLATPPTHALTSPVSGASAFPTGTQLSLPFPAGNRIRLTAAYNGMGSSLHTGVTQTCCANDYYALDLVYEDEANSGLGLPVTAPLAGEVVLSGWSSAGWANYGLRVVLRHDLGDGHVYHTLYAHLNAIDPAITPGAQVAAGQTLGELGGSCQGALSCGSFSTPHLHWTIHRDSSIGGSGSGGSYGGNAVVPEPLDGAENLQVGMIVTSANTGNPVCGDGFCNGSENNSSCPNDCPVCESIPAAGRIVDEAEEQCFSARGDPQYWRGETNGYAGSLLWTHTTDASSADNHGIWNLEFDEAGRYELEAYTASGFAQATQAAYNVRHHGQSTTVVVDQSAFDGWNRIGEFDFSQGGAQFVRLDDNTGEPFGTMTRIAFDALRLTRVDAPGGAGGSSASGGASAAGAAGAGANGQGGSTGGTGSDAGGSGWAPGAGGVSAPGGSWPGAGEGAGGASSTHDGGGNSAPPPAAGGSSSARSGCALAPRRGPRIFWLLLTLSAFLRRRRGFARY